jgi:hypothetical protein
VVALTTIVVKIAGMSDLHVMNATGTIVITEMIVLLTAATALDLLLHLVAQTTKNVVPGPHPPGERLMIEGLQGTMITDAGAMMTAERHLIFMTDAGTIMIDAATTENAMTRMNATTKGLQGTRMGMAGGLVDNWS